MRTITTHHDGHGLNESVTIEAQEDIEGPACHRYEFYAVHHDAPAAVSTVDP